MEKNKCHCEPSIGTMSISRTVNGFLLSVGRSAPAFVQPPLAAVLAMISCSLLLSTYSYSANAAIAKAAIQSTDPAIFLSGEATLEETPEGLQVNVSVVGVSPGRHGFHIHEKGDCGEKGNAAGTHFNPDAVGHGDLAKDGFGHAHAGDLGNIEIDPQGNGKLEKVLPGLTLMEGKYGVMGRSLVLHEKEDGFGQPTGNAGARIGCGVIEPAEDENI